jgi:DNA-binding NtrC family response regulator
VAIRTLGFRIPFLMQVRPTFLVVEPEPGHALSTRKILLETAKFNVITAHSWLEASALFGLFPAVNGVIVTNEVDDGISSDDFAHVVRTKNPKMPIIVIGDSLGIEAAQPTYRIPPYEPEQLILLLRELFGDPRPFDSEQQQ